MKQVLVLFLAVVICLCSGCVSKESSVSSSSPSAIEGASNQDASDPSVDSSTDEPFAELSNVSSNALTETELREAEEQYYRLINSIRPEDIAEFQVDQLYVTKATTNPDLIRQWLKYFQTAQVEAQAYSKYTGLFYLYGYYDHEGDYHEIFTDMGGYLDCYNSKTILDVTQTNGKWKQLYEAMENVERHPVEPPTSSYGSVPESVASDSLVGSQDALWSAPLSSLTS